MEKQDLFLEGIPVGGKYTEYTKEQLAVMPPIPEFVRGEDYPEYYVKEAPIYWDGEEWVLVFD